MNFTSLLNWISGKKSETPVQETESSLERRRFFRVNLGDGEVFLDDQGPFGLSNLSFGGLRIRLENHPFMTTAKIGGEYKAKIRLGNFPFSVRITVCNLGKNEIGCSFVDLSPNQSRILSEFLKPKILGASLQEINSSNLKNPDENLRLRWFQGEDGTQIFLWQTLDGQMVKEEFYFFDYVISYDQTRKVLQTGMISDDLRGKAGFGRIDASSIAFFKVPSYRALKLGRNILEFSKLPMEAKVQLLAGILREERRLYNRFVLGEKERSVKFYLKGEYEKVLSLANLSLKGIAFLRPEDSSPEDFGVGREITGFLEIPNRRLRVAVSLVYCHDQVMGGTLNLQETGDSEAIAEFLGPRLLGQSLEEVSPPQDHKFFAPSGTRSYLYIGVHNTHILAMVAPKNRLVYGRIAFMDYAVVFERNQLSFFSTGHGIIFPGDWELSHDMVERMNEPSPVILGTCIQMLDGGSFPEDLVLSWKAALKSG